PIMRIASQYVKISLQLEESTYFFVCKDNTTCDVIRFNITTMKFSYHQQNVKTPEGFNLFKQPRKIIQINKNYGQFPDAANQHLWMARYH
ncbi:MAG: hypothetical protein LBC04_00525, partial [Holosporaceae bacterium]|nr:hypothetical protein [Holosporaceae bacterium]